MIQRSYKFRIYPNRTQEKQLAVFFGQVRFVWNHCLSLRSDLYEFRKESINYVGLNKHLTYLKTTGKYQWLKLCPSAPLTQVLIDQDKAFKNFFEGRAKYPKFRKKGNAESMRFQLDQRQIERTYKAGELLKLPKLGAVKVKWSRIPAGVPKMATISKGPTGKYWVAFSVEEDIKQFGKTNHTVGVDVGIKDVIVTSDGFHSGAPKNTYRYARKLKLAQRKLSRKRKGSNRWRKQRQVVMRQEHRAGEKLFVDYAGATVSITDPESGETRPAQIFVAVLGASNYTFAWASLTPVIDHRFSVRTSVSDASARPRK